MVRVAAAALSTHELKDLESSVIALRNQKLQEEKDALTKGKKGARGGRRSMLLSCMRVRSVTRVCVLTRAWPRRRSVGSE